MEKTFDVGGLNLDLPIILGAGVCKMPEQVLAYQGDVPVGAVVSGSYTMIPREGNSGVLFWPEHVDNPNELLICLNSYGMPNCGFHEAYVRFQKIKDQLTKPLIVSIAGFSPDDYKQGVAFFQGARATAVELNFGCPNTEEGGRIMSFDLKNMERTFRLVREALEASQRIPIWVKFSPYSDPYQLAEVASIVMDYKDTVDAVVTSNTFPNAVMRNGKGKVTTPNKGRAGLSGTSLKAITLGQVEQFHELLNQEIDIIGVGGITNGQDVIDLLESGAKSVQLVSLPFCCGGARALQNLLLESEALQEYCS